MGAPFTWGCSGGSCFEWWETRGLGNLGGEYVVGAGKFHLFMGKNWMGGLPRITNYIYIDIYYISLYISCFRCRACGVGWGGVG